MGFRPAAWMLLLASLVAAAGGLAQEGWRTIPYEKLHKALTSLQPLEGAKYVHLRQSVAVTAPGMTLRDLEIIVDAAGGGIPVPISADGTLDFPLTETLLAENPPVRVNAPDGGLSLNLSIDTGVPPAQGFSYGLIADMAAEYDRFIAGQGMLARMMAPDVEGLRVQFEPGAPATATITGPAGESLRADPAGDLVIPLRRDWASERPAVRLSRPPAAMRLSFED